MINIPGIDPISGPRGIEPINAIPVHQAESGLGEIADVVEISTASLLAARIHEIPSVRVDLVARVKEEIAAGTYETDERIELAAERILDELLPEM